MPRKIPTDYRPEMLRSIVQRLERLAGRLQAVAVWMEEDDVAELSVTNSASMLQGLESAEAFGQACERARDMVSLGISDTGREKK